jgi:indolepyruvate ferredoxin oxidoreductase beta subunit
MAAIDVWQRDLKNSLQVSPAFSAALAELPRVLKGYSDTLQRGKSAYEKITTAIVRPSVDCATQDQDAAHLRSAISAALADDSHERLDAVLAETTKAA